MHKEWGHEGLDPSGPGGVPDPVASCPVHRAGEEEAAGVGSGCLSAQVAVVQRCGARLKPQQFSALCVLLQRVVLLSGAPDADRQ